VNCNVLHVCAQKPKEAGGKAVSDQWVPPFVIVDEQDRPVGPIEVLGPCLLYAPCMVMRLSSGTRDSPMCMCGMHCATLSVRALPLHATPRGC
jgi:hypothetical protein